MTKTLKKELRTCQELESSSSGYPNIGEVANLKPEGTFNLNKKEVRLQNTLLQNYFAMWH